MIVSTTTWQINKLDPQIKKLAGRGLQAAGIYFHNQVKQLISVPAPRKKIMGRYVATVPATPGAPPRKLSGKLRQSIAWQMMNQGNTVRVGTNLIYARRLEKGPGGHSFLVRTLNEKKDAIAAVMGRTLNAQVG